MHIREKKGGMERFVDNELLTALALGHAYITAFSFQPRRSRWSISQKQLQCQFICLERLGLLLSAQCNWTIHINLFSLLNSRIPRFLHCLTSLFPCPVSSYSSLHEVWWSQPFQGSLWHRILQSFSCLFLPASLSSSLSYISQWKYEFVYQLSSASPLPGWIWRWSFFQ